MENSEKTPQYPMFRGLQRPLEFLGLQGRYITWAAIAAGCALLGFMIGYVAAGFGIGLAIFFASVCLGGGFILVKQSKGLHSKKIVKGIFVYARSKNL